VTAVTNSATGRFCIHITDITPGSGAMLAGVDYQFDSTSPGGTTKAFAETQSNSTGCTSGDWTVATMKQTFPATAATTLSLNNEPFFFMVP
jgi:hypothetical protein